MNIRQEETTKVTEASITTKCMAGGDKWKREVVGVGGAEFAEPADGIPSYGWACAMV